MWKIITSTDEKGRTHPTKTPNQNGRKCNKELEELNLEDFRDKIPNIIRLKTVLIQLKCWADQMLDRLKLWYLLYKCHKVNWVVAEDMPQVLETLMWEVLRINNINNYNNNFSNKILVVTKVMKRVIECMNFKYIILKIISQTWWNS